MTVKEEQKVSQTIKELQKVKPLVPYHFRNADTRRAYQENSKKIAEIKAKLVVAKKNQKDIWEKLQPAIDAHEKVKKDMELLNKEWDDLSEDAKVEQKKIELVDANIYEIKKKRDEIVNKYYEEDDKYFQQQKLIRKIEWMLRQKEYLQDRARIQKEREEEEKSRIPVHPYLQEMEICDQLIAYCKRMIGTKKEEEKKEVAKTEKSILSTKSGVVVVVDKKKKEEEGMVVVGGGKKKKEKKERSKKGKKAAEERFQIDFGMLSLFDKVQLQPPLQMKEVQPTLEKLVAKKKYFNELPPKEPEDKKPAETKKEEPAAKKEEAATVPAAAPADKPAQ